MWLLKSLGGFGDLPLDTFAESGKGSRGDYVVKTLHIAINVVDVWWMILLMDPHSAEWEWGGGEGDHTATKKKIFFLYTSS